MVGDEPLPGVGTAEQARFHRRFHRYTIFARWALALVLVGAAVGVVGSGPVSWAQAHEGDLTVSYERFTRNGATWALSVEAPAPVEGPLRITIDRGFHGTQRLEAVTPQPDAVRADDREVTYEFAPGSAAERISVEFHFMADALGLHHADVGLAGGPTTGFRQFIYP